MELSRHTDQAGIASIWNRAQVFIDGSGRFPPFRDGPHYQRLSTPHIARGKNSLDGSHVAVVGRDIAPSIDGYTQLFKHAVSHWAREAHSQQDQINFKHKFAARLRLEFRRRTHLDTVKLFYIAMLITDKLCCCQAPIPLAAFFMCPFGTQLHRPQRPWRKWRPRGGRYRHDFKLLDRQRLLAMTCSQAVCPSISASNDDDALAARQDRTYFRNRVAFTTMILLRQEFHREVNAVQLTSRNV